ncbi:MAG: hypothetical protein Q7R65_00680, partial [bacterium]|nr:hypothetical protein [bacterium]
LVFVIVLVVSLPLRISVAPVNVGAHPLGVGRPSENARGGAQGSKTCACPSPREDARAPTRARTNPAGSQRGFGGSLY